MKKATIEAPSYVPLEKPEDWDLHGVVLHIDDSLRRLTKDRINRRATALVVKARRLAAEGRSIYEDDEACDVMAAHYEACRQAIRKVEIDGKELTPNDADQLLDEVGLIARDEICNAVVEANSLGRKNG